MLGPSLRDMRARKGNSSGFEADSFRGPDIGLGNRLGALKKSAGVWIGRGDGIVATDCNLVNVGTVIFVVVT